MKPLTNELAVHTAAMERKTVAVFLGKERLGTGTIEEISTDCVKINGEWYMRASCAFWIVEN